MSLANLLSHSAPYLFFYLSNARFFYLSNARRFYSSMGGGGGGGGEACSLMG
jgi:hypothetical protein